MLLKVTCSNGHHLQVKSEFAGRNVHCPKCKVVIHVPAEAADAPGSRTHQRATRSVATGLSASRNKTLVFTCAVALLAVLGVAGVFVLQSWRGARQPVASNPAKDRTDIEVVSRQFFDAMRDRSEEGFYAAHTEKARNLLKKAPQQEKERRLNGVMRPGTTYQIEKVDIDGDLALVPVVTRQGNEEHRMILMVRREKPGRWGAYGIKVPEMEMTINWEEPEKSVMFGMNREQMNAGTEQGVNPPMQDAMNKANDAFADSMSAKPTKEDYAAEAFQSLNLEQFDAAWRQNLDIHDQPAMEALSDLAGKLEWNLNLTPAQRAALTGPISLQLQGQSRWKLLEEITRLAGYYPVYSGFNSSQQRELTLKQLPRLQPIAFAGPFRIEIGNVQEFPTNAVGVLHSRIQVDTLPAGTITMWSKGVDKWLSVDELVDNQNRDISDLGSGGSPLIVEGLVATHDSQDRIDAYPRVALKNLLRDATSIKRFRGRIRLALPSRVEQLRFDPLTDGTTKKSGDFEATLNNATKGSMGFNDKQVEHWNLSFKIKGEGVTTERVKIVAYNSKQELIGLSSSSSSRSGNELRIDKQVIGQTPAAVEVKIAVEAKTIEYEFQFEDIPLASDPRKPEKIVAATFPGHEEPFSAEFVEIAQRGNFTKAKFLLKNHADKDIRNVDLKLEYLNTAGAKIGEHLSSYRPTVVQSGELSIAVEKLGTAPVEITAFFAKPETVRMTATPIKAFFADGTEWNAPTQVK